MVLEVCLWYCSLLGCGVRWYKSPRGKRDLCQLPALVQQQVYWELKSFLNKCRLQKTCHLLKSTSFSGARVLMMWCSTLFTTHMQHASVSIWRYAPKLTEKGDLLLRWCWQIFLVCRSKRGHANLHQCCYRSLKQRLITSNSRWYQCNHWSLVPQRIRSPL